MVENSLDGRWPWEAGEMPVEQAKPADTHEPAVPLYVLPKVKAKRGEPADSQGMRPITAKERAQQLKQDDIKGHFKWRS